MRGAYKRYDTKKFTNRSLGDFKYFKTVLLQQQDVPYRF